MNLIIRDDTHLIFDNAKLFFCNFAGKAQKMNDKGKRNFRVRIDDPDIARELMDRQVRVRLEKKWHEDDPDTWSVKVIANYDGNYPPKIKSITSTKIETMNRDNVGELDQRGVIDHAKFEVNLSWYDDTELKKRMRCMYLVAMKAYLNEDWFDNDEDEEAYQPALPGMPEPVLSEDEDIPF